jgi:hypothetical protein
MLTSYHGLDIVNIMSQYLSYKRSGKELASLKEFVFFSGKEISTFLVI